MDVKVGSGAFMPTYQASEALVQSIVGVANDAGCQTTRAVHRAYLPAPMMSKAVYADQPGIVSSMDTRALGLAVAAIITALG